MTRARPLAALAAAAWLLLVAAPSVRAQQTQGLGWRVTAWSAPHDGAWSGPVEVSGTIVDDLGGRITSVSLTLEPIVVAEGCEPATAVQTAYADAGGPVTTPTTGFEDQSVFDFEFSVLPTCNGTYHASVVGTSVRPGQEQANESDPMQQTAGEPPNRNPVVHTVAAAPPDVASLVSQVAGRTVRLGWQPPPGYTTTPTTCTATEEQQSAAPPDFVGYVVQRETAGAWVTLPEGEVAAGTQCLQHQEAADVPSGTSVRYRVLAVREGPDGRLTAAGGSTAVVTAIVDPPPPSTVPPTTRPPRTGGTPQRPSGGRAGGGGSAIDHTSGTTPTTIEDGTYEEELDYGEPGEEAAVVPDDADTFLDFVPSPGQGILVPFAVAECLAVWAFHLRYLARRADDGF